MRIYISVDIEGICDVVNAEHTGNKGFLYNSAREQMTREANAAIKGAIRAGATEIVVNDSHGPMVNIIPKLLHRKAELITGTTKPMVMMQGIDEGFDAAMFIGYHSRSNTPGVLSHTISSRSVANIWVNDKVIGETGFNTLIAGAYNVPVILVSGDQYLCAEAKEFIGEAVTAVKVKDSITRLSAKCLHPEVACERIEEAAYNAVNNIECSKPYKIKGPYTAKIQFFNSGQADNASRLPNSVRINGDTLSYSGDNIVDVLHGIMTMINLC